jgi:CheY-like chemotaxis protein
MKNDFGRRRQGDQPRAGSHGAGRQCYAVIEAGDGQETLRNARESKPDLILLDLHMPASTALAWSAKSGSIPNWPPRP